MKKILFYCFLLTAISCTKSKNNDPDNPDGNGKYDNGFYILNSFGDSTWKDVSFYSYTNDSFYVSGYRGENPGHVFGAETASLTDGKLFGGKLYLVASGKGHVVIVNPSTLKEIVRIRSTAALDPHVFLGISGNEALLSTGDGIYRMSLSKPALGTRISGVDGPIGTMVKSGNYIFAHSMLDRMVIVLDATTYNVVKKIPAAFGLVVSKDGFVWGTGALVSPYTDRVLLRINPATLKADSISLPFYPGPIYSSTTFRSNLAASTKENVLYLVNFQRIVYRYVIGDPSSLNTPIVTLPFDEQLTGEMVEYDPQNDKLILMGYDKSFVASRKNKIYICNPVDGTILKTISYLGYYYAGVAVFH